jgi:hypothetical protein
VREREGGSSTIQMLYLGFAEISIYVFSFLCPPRQKIRKKALADSSPDPSSAGAKSKIPSEFQKY